MKPSHGGAEGPSSVSPERAEALVKDGARRVRDADVQSVVAQEDKLSTIQKTGRLRAIWQDVRTTASMVRDYAGGRYREVPWMSIASAVVGLLYLLNPFDLVPDAVPFFGQIDDVVVLTACIKLLRKDLDRYRAWLAQGEAPSGPDQTS